MFSIVCTLEQEGRKTITLRIKNMSLINDDEIFSEKSNSDCKVHQTNQKTSHTRFFEKLYGNLDKHSEREVYNKLQNDSFSKFSNKTEININSPESSSSTIDCKSRLKFRIKVKLLLLLMNCVDKILIDDFICYIL